jgi:phosphate starvation-inducible PhoH-like protein
VIAAGSAGTGKTMFAVTKAIQDLQNGKVDRIVITRPAVSVDEEHGFLPGTLEEKMAPWVRPIYDVFEEYYSPRDIASMMEERIIEIAPLAYMRGRTFVNSFIIIDEAQLTTQNQMKMALTRAGSGSRIVVTGDTKQSDQGKQGLADVLHMLHMRERKGDNINGIRLVEFKHEHVERSETTKMALELFGEVL